MACRSHNETFILLRNNAQKNRSFYRDVSLFSCYVQVFFKFINSLKV